MVTVRRATTEDSPGLWALSDLPFKGNTADTTVPLDLPVPDRPPSHFVDLADVVASYHAVGGEFVVAELDGHVVGMGGFRPLSEERVDVLRVRAHPAVRRAGVATAVMAELETRAVALGYTEMFLDTTTEQPEAIAFYRAIGYVEVGRETRPDWNWTLVYFCKTLNPRRS